MDENLCLDESGPLGCSQDSCNELEISMLNLSLDDDDHHQDDEKSSPLRQLDSFLSYSDEELEISMLNLSLDDDDHVRDSEGISPYL